MTLASTSMALAFNSKQICWIRCVLCKQENGGNQQKAWASNVLQKGTKRGVSMPNSWLAFHMERVCFFASNILCDHRSEVQKYYVLHVQGSIHCKWPRGQMLFNGWFPPTECSSSPLILGPNGMWVGKHTIKVS